MRLIKFTFIYIIYKRNNLKKIKNKLYEREKTNIKFAIK